MFARSSLIFLIKKSSFSGDNTRMRQLLHKTTAKNILTMWLIVQVFYLTNVYPFSHRHNVPHHHSYEVSECCGCQDGSTDHIHEDSFVHFHQGCGPDCHQQEEGNHFDPDARFLVSKISSKLSISTISLVKTVDIFEPFEQQESSFPVILVDRAPTLSTFCTSINRRGPPDLV